MVGAEQLGKGSKFCQLVSACGWLGKLSLLPFLRLQFFNGQVTLTELSALYFSTVIAFRLRSQSQDKKFTVYRDALQCLRGRNKSKQCKGKERLTVASGDAHM